MAGADAIVAQEVLARIAASDNPRSYETLLDTVKGYRPGNWIYEWSQEAGRCQSEAKAVKEQDPLKARDLLLSASLYYTIASYPHLRGDMLALEARVQSDHAYSEAGLMFPCPLRRLQIPFQKHHIRANLHLPHDEFPAPVVLVCGGGDVLQNGFFHLFDKVLRPAGLAMLTVDMPGVGSNQRWPFTEDVSRLHQAVLEYLPNCPWVDDKNAAMIGLRMGGNIATRLAYLKPGALRAVVNFGGPIHEIFVNGRIKDKMSPMLEDQIASRLYTGAIEMANFTVKAQIFSLVRQGLFNRKTRVPILVVGMKGDEQFPESDIKRLMNACSESKRIQLDKTDIVGSMDNAFLDAANWLKKYMS
jgi:esterase FrsA